MQLKRYEASTIKEAIKKIKTELGKDAVIFSSRTIMPENRLDRKYVEVTAAVDRDVRGCLDADVNKKHLCTSIGDSIIQSSNKTETAISGIFDNPYNSRKLNNSAVSSFTTIFSHYFKNLLMSGFSHDIAWYLIGEANSEYVRLNKTTPFKNILLQKISAYVPVEGPISVNIKTKKIAAFIGPTGVGKTTTLAKIAARCTLIKGIKIKIITMDTYRIAAAEQLRIYGKIMRVPVSVVFNHEELEREIRREDDVNLILIDTAGRNYRDGNQMLELNSWLTKYEEIESHLLLSATTSEDVLMSTMKCFNNSRVNRIIITKVDESETIGHLYDLIISVKIPVSYITTGQKVPEDIKTASAEFISDIFLNGFRDKFQKA